MQKGRGERWRVVAAVAVIIVGGGLLAVLAMSALTRVPGDQKDLADAQHLQFSCVSDELRREVPPGGRVRIASRQELLDADPRLPPTLASLWYQRLTELAYPEIDLVGDRSAEVDAVVMLEPFGTGGCDGVGVTVEEP